MTTEPSPRRQVHGAVPPATLLCGLVIVAILLGAAVGAVSAGIGRRLLALVVGGIAAVSISSLLARGAVAKFRELGAQLRWWHLLWCLVFLSALVFRVRDIDTVQQAPLDLWAAWRIGAMGLVALVLLSRLAGRRPDWSPALVQGLPAGLFLCTVVSLVSTLWSVYPMWTLYKSLEYLVDVALLAAILSDVRRLEELKSLFDLTWVFSGLLVASVWLGVLLRPDLALAHGIGLIDVQIHGVLPVISANGTGDEAGLLLMVAATRLLFRSTQRRFYWLVCAGAIPTLVFAQSRSPIAATLLALGTILLLARRYRLLALVAVAGIALFSVTAAETVVTQAFMRGQNAGLFLSLSGRTDWWGYGWQVFRESPLLGLGGYAGARFAVLGPMGVTEASSIHNAWLEILLGVGVLGFLPFLVTFVGTWRRLLVAPPDGASPQASQLRLEAIGLFVILTFRSVFSVGFIWHPPLLFFLVLMYAEGLRRTSLARANAAIRIRLAGQHGRLGAA